MKRRLAIAWTGFLAEALRMTDQFLTGLGYLHGKATIVASQALPEPVRPQGERTQ